MSAPVPVSLSSGLWILDFGLGFWTQDLDLGLTEVPHLTRTNFIQYINKCSIYVFQRVIDRTFKIVKVSFTLTEDEILLLVDGFQKCNLEIYAN